MIVFLRVGGAFLVAIAALVGIQFGLCGELKVGSEPVGAAGRVFCVLLGFVLAMSGMACEWAYSQLTGQK